MKINTPTVAPSLLVLNRHSRTQYSAHSGGAYRLSANHGHRPNALCCNAKRDSITTQIQDEWEREYPTYLTIHQSVLSLIQRKLNEGCTSSPKKSYQALRDIQRSYLFQNLIRRLKQLEQHCLEYWRHSETLPLFSITLNVSLLHQEDASVFWSFVLCLRKLYPKFLHLDLNIYLTPNTSSVFSEPYLQKILDLHQLKHATFKLRYYVSASESQQYPLQRLSFEVILKKHAHQLTLGRVLIPYCQHEHVDSIVDILRFGCLEQSISCLYLYGYTALEAQHQPGLFTLWPLAHSIYLENIYPYRHSTLLIDGKVFYKHHRVKIAGYRVIQCQMPQEIEEIVFMGPPWNLTLADVIFLFCPQKIKVRKDVYEIDSDHSKHMQLFDETAVPAISPRHAEKLKEISIYDYTPAKNWKMLIHKRFQHICIQEHEKINIEKKGWIRKIICAVLQYFCKSLIRF